MGFFTRADRKGKPARQVSQETLRAMGTAISSVLNPAAKSPNMRPSGAKRPKLYVLGEAPADQDDQRGEPWSGAAGEMLRSMLGRDCEFYTTFDNVVRTRPLRNRTPTPDEVECFRESVTKSIVARKPRVIIAAGNTAYRWFTGLTNLQAARGSRFPVRVGTHECWMVPVLHPSLLMRVGDLEFEGVRGTEWRRVWDKDMRFAVDLAFDEEAAVPEIILPEEARADVELLTSLPKIEAALRYFLTTDLPVGFDLETNKLRPYSKGAKILSVSFATKERASALGVEHPECNWAPSQLAHIYHLLQELFQKRKGLLVAHNLQFDIEWLIHFLGLEVLENLKKYHCSMQAAYAFDPGPPGKGTMLSLGAQTMLHYGLPLKKVTEAAGLRGALETVKLDEVLLYNALDSRFAVKLLVEKLLPQLRENNLEESYQRQMARVVPLVLMQRSGVPVDVPTVRALKRQFESNILQSLVTLKKLESVKRFSRIYGKPLNPDSSKDVGRLLVEIDGLDELRTDKGGYTTAAPILQTLRDRSDVVDVILGLRGMKKLQTTYCDKFLPEHPQSFLYPDGKIHANFSSARTRTARLASSDPNNQNWPKRKNKLVREIMKAPFGWSFVACDYGQIEARVLAMASKDPAWIKMLMTDYDVHMEWAEKIVRVHKSLLRQENNDWKAVRNVVKNKFVFPAFYGSSVNSIAEDLNLDLRKAQKLFDEFWSIFRGIKRWQKELWDTYLQTGEVRSLTGRRRLAPLSWNMVINSGIQCTASDMAVDAMVRLCLIGLATSAPWLITVLQVHDDLTFLVPDDQLEGAIFTIKEEMLNVDADYVNVPLLVEVEVGPDLYHMEPLDKYKRMPKAA